MAQTPPRLPPRNELNVLEEASLNERKARTEMWNAITKLLEKAFELLVQEAERKRREN